MKKIELDTLMNLDADFPGFDIWYELWAMEQYLRVIVEHLPDVIAQAKRRAETELKKLDRDMEEGEIKIRRQEIAEVAKTIIPRFFWGPTIVSLWALYESSVEDLAEYVQKREGAKLSLDDIRAKNFRERTAKYFAGVLDFDFGIDRSRDEKLRIIQEFRNLFAHDGGRLNGLSSQRQTEIRKLVENAPGVEIKNDVVYFSSSFLRDCFTTIEDILEHMTWLLAKRYRRPVVSK